MKDAGLSGGFAKGPSTSPFAICLYAASVRWGPSQFIYLEGSEQTVVLGPPQHAFKVLLLSKPA